MILESDFTDTQGQSNSPGPNLLAEVRRRAVALAFEAHALRELLVEADGMNASAIDLARWLLRLDRLTIAVQNLSDRVVEAGPAVPGGAA